MAVIFFIPLLISLLSALSSTTDAEIQFHDFVVQETPVKRLCRTKNVITVNGQFPGPTLEVSDGDMLIVRVLNNARYNVTIHWHGILQLGTPWADGPDRITQCPIQPGASYTYRFTILNQEGTLWWHAHSRWLRATVYGALIIHPKLGSSYPFPLPKLEIPILLGQWWNGDIISILNQAMLSGGAPNVSDAYTINGQPGDLYRCSSKDTMRFYVESDDRILLRVINSALNQQLFFTVANHKLTVVGVDALYTKPFTTTTLMLGPGQTTDVILVADQAPGYYYMAARAYESSQNAPFDNTTTTAILAYKFAPCINGQIGTPVKPVLPRLPNYNDSVTVAAFTTQLKSPSKVEVPLDVTEDLFFAIGLGLVNCNPGPACQGPNNTRFAASMNNVSFVLPQTTSLLQAHYQNIPNVFTTDFPPVPPLLFDYTGNVPRALWQPVSGTKLYKLKFGSQVQIVLQDTAIVSIEDHPVHLHGHHFYIVGQGFGNFNPGDTVNFNLEDPPRRNTVNVPVGGWSAIRFVANNPGVWLMHCHIDSHLTWGFAMSFLVENGPGKLESIEAPPLDLPPC